MKRAQAQVNTLVLGKPQEVRLAFVALLSGRPPADRGPARPRQDHAGACAGGDARAWVSSACSSPPTCCRRTSSACRSTTRRRGASNSIPGPVFAHVLLADEINRAPPRTQSALLEAMAEHQVTVDGTTHALPRSVLRHRHAESGRPCRHLSAARFAARPLPAAAHAGLSGRGRRTRAARRQRSPRPDRAGRRRCSAQRRRAGNCAARSPECMPAMRWSPTCRRCWRAAASHPGVRVGLSPRAGIALLRAARAYALLLGRGHVAARRRAGAVRAGRRAPPGRRMPMPATTHALAKAILHAVAGGLSDAATAVAAAAGAGVSNRWRGRGSRKRCRSRSTAAASTSCRRASACSSRRCCWRWCSAR